MSKKAQVPFYSLWYHLKSAWKKVAVIFFKRNNIFSPLDFPASSWNVFLHGCRTPRSCPIWRASRKSSTFTTSTCGPCPPAGRLRLSTWFYGGRSRRPPTSPFWRPRIRCWKRNTDVIMSRSKLKSLKKAWTSAMIARRFRVIELWKSGDFPTGHGSRESRSSGGENWKTGIK